MTDDISNKALAILIGIAIIISISGVFITQKNVEITTMAIKDHLETNQVEPVPEPIENIVSEENTTSEDNVG